MFGSSAAYAVYLRGLKLTKSSYAITTWKLKDGKEVLCKIDNAP